MNPADYSGIKPTRKDYCQFIMATFANYTKTYMADHFPVFSHDSINRLLMGDDVSPYSVWQSVGHWVRRSGNACLVFDDTVADKRHSFKMELVRRQYSGNEHGVIKGIGVADCLSVNLDTGEYWVIDWRIHDPDGDGKAKPGHVREMFEDAIQAKNLPFRTVLMDSWYATKDLMMHIDRAGKVFYCPPSPTARWTTAAEKPLPASFRFVLGIRDFRLGEKRFAIREFIRRVGNVFLLPTSGKDLNPHPVSECWPVSFRVGKRWSRLPTLPGCPLRQSRQAAEDGGAPYRVR